MSSTDNKNDKEKELTDAIRDLLESSGHLNKLQAEMRAKVIETLKERQDRIKTGDSQKGPPPQAEEILLVNELIREYLEWNGYLYTSSVLTSEVAMATEKLTRAELCSRVGVKDDERSSALPLLSNIVAAYMERIKRKINKKCNKNGL